MSEVWTKWEGHQAGGTLPLLRYLGSSDHSGVFLTEIRGHGLAQGALKLIPANPDLAQRQLTDWRAAAGLAYPHLIRLLATGRCQLDGRPYLYVAMEYADQNLAQLLSHRALTEDEAREMLPPMLNALAFLHDRNLVQGQLKPANILAVGDQLKLASDTIRRVSEAGADRRRASVYEPPEARDGSYSIAGDVWGLGVSLLEALTRSPFSGLQDGRGEVALPRDFSPTFRELIASCLSRSPADRPKVAEIESWVRRQSVGPVPIRALQPGAVTGPIAPASAPGPTAPASAPGPIAPASAPGPTAPASAPGPTAPASAPGPTASASAPGPAASASAPRQAPRQAAASEQVARASAVPAPKTPQAVATRAAGPGKAAPATPKWGSLVPLFLGALVILGVTWTGMRVLGTHRHPAAPTLQVPGDASPPAPDAAAPVRVSASSGKPASEAAASPSAVHEVIPEVPRRARQTIHGQVRVAVRVIVDPEGTVLAALVDQPGPSRYFERLAIEAAKKWTFPPADTQAQRLKLVRFEFSRDGTRGHAVSLQ
jgi:TonB family protein